MKVAYRDLVESLLVFFICLISSLVICAIHASYFTPYIEKDFMVELSFSLTFVTALFVGFEWSELKKEKK